MSTTTDRPPEPPREVPDPSAGGRRHPALDIHVGERHTNDSPIDKIVFGITAVLAIVFLLWGFLSTATLSSASGSALEWTMAGLDWFFVLIASGFVVFSLWLALGRFGAIPLGRDDEVPEFRTSSWIAMMFSAGMGIGLMFYGVNEPLTFFADGGDFAVPGSGGQTQAQLAETAMAQTLFHWTFHPWAIYAVVG
ncbi:MAG: BCCT family transporter, partial [Nocardioides sp.]